MKVKAGHASSDINTVDLLLILLVTVSWGLNYPIMKFVVTDFPPLTFRAFTFTIGFVLLGAYALYQGDSLRVPSGERLLALQLGIPNMVLWHVGLIYGVLLLNSGRAAIVGYTMPVWALIASVIFFSTLISFFISHIATTPLPARWILSQVLPILEVLISNIFISNNMPNV